jgi:hypothetical protein
MFDSSEFSASRQCCERRRDRKIGKIVLALLVLAGFAIATIGSAYADASVTRDTDSTPGASVPTTGTHLSMYKGFALNSCSYNPPIDPNIAPGSVTWPANSAFFVRHGWIENLAPPYTNQTLAAFDRPTTNFELYVDHVQQQSLPDFYAGHGFKIKLFVINFPNGLTGTHLFQGWWFEDGYIVGGTPNTQVIQLACNLQITFV